MKMTDEAKGRVERHLEEVEGVLRGRGMAREERRGVVDDLEAQIGEMLRARGESVGVVEVEGVLSELDPPGAYGAERVGEGAGVGEVGVGARVGGAHGVEAMGVGANVGPAAGGAGTKTPAGIPERPAKRRYSKTAIFGLVCILVSFVPTVLVMAVMLVSLRTFVRMPVTASPRISEERREAPVLPATMQTEVIPATTATARATTQAAPGGVLIGPDGMKVRSGGGNRLEVGPGGVYAYRATDGSDLAVGAPRKWVVMAPCTLCVMPLGLLGTVLGWVAFGQIRSSKGMVRGMGMALFDGLFYPVMGVLGLVLCLVFWA